MSKYLQQWREKLEATEEIELSIGPAVIRSNVSLLDMVAAGHIPQTLLLGAHDAAKGKRGKELDDEALQRMGLEKLPELLPGLDALAIAVFIDPPLSKEGDENSLSVSKVPTLDKLNLFNYLNRGAEALRPFRGEEGEPAGVTRAGVDVPRAAVDAAGA